MTVKETARRRVSQREANYPFAYPPGPMKPKMEGGPGSGRHPEGGAKSGGSKVHNILGVIEGSHVQGPDGLRDYHTARQVRDSMRKSNLAERFSSIRQALKNHRVTVSLDGEQIRIHRPETGQEIKLGSKEEAHEADQQKYVAPRYDQSHDPGFQPHREPAFTPIDKSQAE